MSEWQTEAHVAHYRGLAIPHKDEGEKVLLEVLPSPLERVLDLGTGDGRLLAMVLDARSGATGVGVDFSPPMLALAHERFVANDRAAILAHDLGDPLPDLGLFEAVISGFAIHHLEDARKRELLDEIVACLAPGGVVANLGHVASPTPRLQQEFNNALGITKSDPSNRLVAVETQLEWMRNAGLEDVDCLWKWREMALLTGHTPNETPCRRDVVPESPGGGPFGARHRLPDDYRVLFPRAILRRSRALARTASSTPCSSLAQLTPSGASVTNPVR